MPKRRSKPAIARDEALAVVRAAPFEGDEQNDFEPPDPDQHERLISLKQTLMQIATALVALAEGTAELRRELAWDALNGEDEAAAVRLIAALEELDRTTTAADERRALEDGLRWDDGRDALRDPMLRPLIALSHKTLSPQESNC